MKAAFDHVARRQLGLATHQQLTEHGWTEREIQGARESGGLLVVRRGVYRCDGAPITKEQTWLAAELAAGDHHYLSRITAGAIWAMKGYPSPEAIHLLTASERRCRLDGVVSHRTLWLPPSDVTYRGALPVTSPARTLADTCGDVPFDVLRSAANDAFRRGILRPVDLVRCVEAMPRSGRRAIVPARLLIATFVPGFDPGESDPELDIVEALMAAGYPRPEQQIWVRGAGWRYRIDVGYSCVKHGFEYQSEQEHLNRESFHTDQLRTSRLQRAGWTIWPITSRTSRAELLLNAASGFGHLRTSSVHE